MLYGVRIFLDYYHWYEKRVKRVRTKVKDRNRFLATLTVLACVIIIGLLAPTIITISVPFLIFVLTAIVLQGLWKICGVGAEMLGLSDDKPVKTKTKKPRGGRKQRRNQRRKPKGSKAR